MLSGWTDTPAAKVLRTLGDLMVLNLLCVACSLVVFTIGPAFSAMYAVLLKLERGDGEIPVIATFFRAFKENFKQALVLGIIYTVCLVFSLGDLMYGLNAQGGTQVIYLAAGTVIGAVTLILLTISFPQQAIYGNSVLGILKNSFLLAFCAPGRLLLSVAAWIVPWAMLIFLSDIFLLKLGMLYFMWGISGPAWATAKLLNGVFQRVEEVSDEKVENSESDEESEQE